MTGVAKKSTSIVTPEHLENMIYTFRNERVMIDADLANLYGVQTRALNQAVKRNLKRFPPEFMFQLSKEEFDDLKSQSVTSSWGGRRKLPFVFTEHGVAMLSSVLLSDRAIHVNIEIIKAFVRLRKIIASSALIASKVEQLEKKLDFHDKAIAVLFDEIRQLVEEPEPEPKGRIGFKVPKR